MIVGGEPGGLLGFVPSQVQRMNRVRGISRPLVVAAFKGLEHVVGVGEFFFGQFVLRAPIVRPSTKACSAFVSFPSAK